MSSTNARVFVMACAMAFIAPPIASAENDNDFDSGYEGRADFRAVLTPVEPGNSATENFSAVARFWLTGNQRRLRYRIRINGMDVTGFTGPGNPPTNDVTKIHMHADSIFGIHVLNVYKAPSEDDNNLVVVPSRNLLLGAWTDADETINPMNPEGGSTLTLSSQIENLCNENLWIVIHGDASVVENPGTFADRVLGGQIVKTRRSNACRRH